MIDRTVPIFKDIFREVIIVTNTPLDYIDQDCVITTDIIKGKGSLGGIYTGLFFASHEHSFVSACDMPFLNKPFIEYMIEHRDNHDIIVPKLPDGLQPLHAIYSKKCLSAIKRNISLNQLKITGFYKGLRVLEVSESVINLFDPECKMFMNINTMNDLDQTSSMIK